MRLGVNVDHIATVRQLRRGVKPDPWDAARVALDAGADGIVAHLREDRRHINDNDLRRLKQGVSARLNLEMSINPQIVDIALGLHPDQATLVPEKRQELTTEGGLDVAGLRDKLEDVVGRLRAAGITVSLFVEPDNRQLDAAKELGARAVELHTGRYSLLKGKGRQQELARIARAAEYGRGIGLLVFAGHGLDYDNVRPVAEIGPIEELNIGYSIICRALFVGLDAAVREMVELCRSARG
ncbi:MAG: pyridoxine 5'-phosphate synthase [Candidatus Omnitrophota bacterium]